MISTTSYNCNLNVGGKRDCCLTLPSNKRHVLESELFWNTVSQSNNLPSLPRSVHGHVGVYFLPNTVIKVAGDNCEKRFKKMRITRLVTEMLDLKGLVIPRARIFKNYLIESRVPIKNVDQKWQTGFYLGHLEALNQAICDFAKLYSQMVIKDIVSYKGDGSIRCDNAPFFKDNDGVCKIALIDLEQVEFSSASRSSEVFTTLVGFFPYHAEILADTLNFDRESEPILKAIERGKSRIQFQYLDHVKFLEMNGISFNNPEKIARPSTDQIAEMTSSLFRKLKVENSAEEILQIMEDFLNTLFSAIAKDYEPRLKASGNLKTNDDLLPLRYFNSRVDRWDSYIEKLKKVSGWNQGDILVNILKLLQNQNLLYSFVMIPDLFEGTYFLELEY